MNITISLSLNFSHEYLKPFLKSFNENVDSELFLITDHNQQTLPFKSNKIHLVSFSELSQKYKIANLTPYNLKPILFYLYLKKLQSTGKYRQCLLSDVDVVFQADPFKVYNNQYIKSDLLLAEERHPYSKCETNSMWYTNGYPHTYNAVKDKKILNCGVTIGSIDSMIDYQKIVTRELTTLISRQNYLAYDQVILNYLVYITKELIITTLPYHNDYITHLSQEDEIKDTSLWIKNNVICNPVTGNPFTVVHQFDKKKGLKEFVFKKYE